MSDPPSDPKHTVTEALLPLTQFVVMDRLVSGSGKLRLRLAFVLCDIRLTSMRVDGHVIVTTEHSPRGQRLIRVVCNLEGSRELRVTNNRDRRNSVATRKFYLAYQIRLGCYFVYAFYTFSYTGLRDIPSRNLQVRRFSKIAILFCKISLQLFPLHYFCMLFKIKRLPAWHKSCRTFER